MKSIAISILLMILSRQSLCLEVDLDESTSNLSWLDYLDLIVEYSNFRHISIWKHFSCFNSMQNTDIAVKLSSKNIQSEFVIYFKNITNITDTPVNAVQGFAVNTRCSNINSIFEQSDQLLLFKNNNFWLFLDDDINGTDYEGDISNETKTLLQALDILPISEVLVVRCQTAKCLLFDVYKIAADFPLEISLFGTINMMPSEDSRILVEPKFLNKLTRKNFHGFGLRCVLVIQYPDRFTSIDDPKNIHVDVPSKSTHGAVKLLADDLNFTCNVLQTDSFGWYINNTWDGAMALFIQNKADLLYHATSMRIDRLRHIEFTTDLAQLDTPFVFRQPSLASTANIFILPFSAEVWESCLVAMFIIWLAMLTQRIWPDVGNRMSVFDVIGFVCGAVCQQGTHLQLYRLSGRIIILTTFLFSLFIFISYSATILVFIQSPSHAIKDINDLIASPLELALQEAKYNRFNYLYENVSILTKVYETKIKPMGTEGWVYDTKVGMEKVRTQLYAFQVEILSAHKAVFETFTDDEKCSLTEIHLLRLPRLTATVMRNSPYKELFRQRLRFQREIGFYNRDKKKWYPKKPLCERNAKKVAPVGLLDIKSAILIWIYGTWTAVIIFILEFFFKWLQPLFTNHFKLSK